MPLKRKQALGRRTPAAKRMASDRGDETPQQTGARLKASNGRQASSRTAETSQGREARLAAVRERQSSLVASETSQEREARLADLRSRQAARRCSRWEVLNNEAFHYDPSSDYMNFPQIVIGKIDRKCNFCDALRFEGEPPGLCCAGGKVKLRDYEELPEPLKSLMNGQHPRSRGFLGLLRKYNSCFQMTSFGTSVPIQTNRGFMPTFRIQGQLYHKSGSLLPLPDEEPKFLQIYFLGDEAAEAQRRCSVIPGVDKLLVGSLQKMLHEHNHYVRTFKMVLDENQMGDDMKIVIKANMKPAEAHSRVFNAPTVNEVAIIIAGNDFEKRDIVLKMRSNELTNISETHISYDALQYPLMFPRGEDGYAIDISQVMPGTTSPVSKMVSAMSFYSYRLMLRLNQTNHLLLFCQLLHQFLVDMYAKIETERLLFIRLNQKKLRVDEYIHLKDAVANDGKATNHGKLVILPSTHIGGPRNMHEYTQDAITYVRHGGKPTFFITYTFNPNCREMQENLLPGQSKTDRHDLVARIFRQKVITFMDVLIKGQVFGPVKYWLYSIEWQKRGLPHAHILIWLKEQLNPNQIDEIISAEVPDETDKELRDTVLRNMVHGPCGTLNPKSPCMKDGKCTKNFPRQLLSETQISTDGYPAYRRRKPQDMWIVPYSPLLLKMFGSHINVEWCNSVKSIKYVLKYIHKGSDQGVFAAQSRDDNNVDEIAEYQAGRYISSNEAAWRIFGFPIHERYPTVMHLDVHLENGQRVYFNESNLQNRINNPPMTTLTGFFELCKTDDFARTLLYPEVARYFTWNKSRRVFDRRKQGSIVEGYDGVRSSEALGRVYTVHLRNFDCYYLRMLLHKVKGPTCFDDLRTVNGVLCVTYQEACLAMGLLENDNQWDETLNEARESDSPSKIRTLFAIILTCCEVSNPKVLWENHKDCMSEDILYRLQQANPHLNLALTGDIYNRALIMIEDSVLDMTGKCLTQFGIASPSRQVTENLSREMLRERSYDAEQMTQYVQLNEPLLNAEQKVIYCEILRRLDENEGGIIFIDAPGGTGKTFLINLLLAKIRGKKKIALAMASSGIAATLMPGGRTAHATLALPIDLIHNETPVCGIKKGTGKAKLLKECEVLFWDEGPMIHKHGLEALNRSLQDIRGNDSIMGGLIVVLAGDFRQTLPIIPRGTMFDEIKASIKSSQLWRYVKKLKLQANVRVRRSNESNAQKFCDYLLSIGNGTEKADVETGKIKLNEDFCRVCSNINSLIEHVYPNLNQHIADHRWLTERAILAPINVKVDEINLSIQEVMPVTAHSFYSIDRVMNEEEDATNYPIEFLNSLSPSGLPQHKLTLKVGSPIMLLRNLDPPKLCNGTRLAVKTLKTSVIEATILTGAFRGESVFIPRIPLISSDLPFEFKRLQFPIRLAFAMTINKSQGQSFNVTGIDLRADCFSHGQLYVAMSRAVSPENLFVLPDENQTTRNIVYTQVLTN